MPTMPTTCRKCHATLTHAKEDLELYKKFEMEPQDLCFDCDQKQRLCFRNERVLYNRKCDATGENIISAYAPDSPYKVYKNDYWQSDKWDPMSFGKDFDFNRPFFDQFRELQLAVPRLALINLNPENSDYCNMCAGNKNCYLVMGGDFNQDCQYGTLCMRNRDSLDIDFSNDNELTYMMDNSMNCYGSQYVWDSKGCNNCFYVSDCIGCNECIFCVNLSNKSFCIDNKQLSKDEYLKRKAEILTGSYKKQTENWRKFLQMRSGRIAKYAHMIGSENCSGDYINNCKNCHNVYTISDSIDVRNCILAARLKDGFNVSFLGHDCELDYSCIAIMDTKNSRFCYWVLSGNEIEYSEQITSCQNLFGCNGLKHKQYCILNKQYSKEDYLALRAKIIEHMKQAGEWGRFFPPELSCYGYNEATGMIYYPLTKEQAMKEGFKWKDEDPRNFKLQTCEIPDSIKDTTEAIISEILACESCKKNYRINATELAFYNKQLIAVPHMCPDCRHAARMALRTPCKIYERKCAKCATILRSTYAPDRPETIYCEKCYLESK